jgi:hypothetical protein
MKRAVSKADRTASKWVALMEIQKADKTVVCLAGMKADENEQLWADRSDNTKDDCSVGK